MMFGVVLPQAALLGLYGFYISEALREPQNSWIFKAVLLSGALLLLLQAFKVAKRASGEASLSKEEDSGR